MVKLADGTVAEIGQKVIILDGKVADGNDTGAVTTIIEVLPEDDNDKLLIKCKSVGRYNMLSWFYESIEAVRLATKEEIAAFKG